jgi:hypothetical protein
MWNPQKNIWLDTHTKRGSNHKRNKWVKESTMASTTWDAEKLVFSFTYTLFKNTLWVFNASQNVRIVQFKLLKVSRWGSIKTTKLEGKNKLVALPNVLILCSIGVSQHK